MRTNLSTFVDLSLLLNENSVGSLQTELVGTIWAKADDADDDDGEEIRIARFLWLSNDERALS